MLRLLRLARRRKLCVGVVLAAAAVSGMWIRSYHYETECRYQWRGSEDALGIMALWSAAGKLYTHYTVFRDQYAQEVVRDKAFRSHFRVRDRKLRQPLLEQTPARFALPGLKVWAKNDEAESFTDIEVAYVDVLLVVAAPIAFTKRHEANTPPPPFRARLR